MYLKALEIQGFKSFPDKTVLNFDKDVTAIVGPNGSGKSNISDAMLWVMGEQRSKALRGGKMEDVIFGGTEKRSPLGFAQVTLIVDNSEHIFDCDNTELMLTRRYYRSGDSEYYINREAVRLKDINSLLMDTGLGRDGYSIIGQGRISEIVSSRASDRREIFEEAAGISRYRSRKEESERKLAKTEENLVRINDKIDELELQVEPLKKQSEVAKKYLVLRDDLRIREISVWMATLDKLKIQNEVVENDYADAKERLDNAHRSLEALYASSENISERMHQKDVEVEQTRAKLSEVEAKISECDSECAVLRANIENSNEAVKRMQSDIEDGSVEVIDRVAVSETGTELALVVQGSVYQVKLSKVDYVNAFYESERLWACSEMKDCALQLLADIPDVPNLMLSFTDGSGSTHELLITMSGEDGSLILVDKNSLQAQG